MVTFAADPGEFTKREAEAYAKAHTSEPNLAADKKLAATAFGHVTARVTEWKGCVDHLHKRWALVMKMLASNTLAVGGPANIHFPELYKALETLVPRLEEIILERDPWFEPVPRQRSSERRAVALGAYMDWLFEQGDLRTLVQPLIRDQILCQLGALHVRWEHKTRKQVVREEEVTWKNGKLRRSIKGKEKEVVIYAGPVFELIDPFNYIQDPKSMSPQKARFVGHRCRMPFDQVLQLGEQLGWVNLDQVEALANKTSTWGQQADTYAWARSPVNPFAQPGMAIQGAPGEIEVTTLYSTMDPAQGRDYDDYRTVLIGDKVVVDLRRNPYDNGVRPYATFRATNGGHELYGIGVFDNGVRLNQQLDRYAQLVFKGSEVSAMPIGFTPSLDNDLPDTLLDAKPFEIFRGIDGINWSQIPDGFLRSAPLIMGMLQRQIEETVGAFRIQMGQDLPGGTATEATLALQEGNRRLRGLVRGLANGFKDLLHITYRFMQQFSTEDVEFPVLGKRAAFLRDDYAKIGFADLLDDVQFTIKGLKSTSNYGMKAVGIQTVLNGAMPLIMQHAQDVDTLAMLHDTVQELVGADEADTYVRRKTPLQDRISQDTENRMLWEGTRVPVDETDDDEDHMQKLMPLYRAALNERSDMPGEVRAVIVQHFLDHAAQWQDKQAQAKTPQPGQMQQLPPEAGGPSQQTPPPGGFSNATMDLANSTAQTPQGETPGPASPQRQGKPSRDRNARSQSDNRRTA